MKFFTSIAPKHYHEARQMECLISWTKWGEIYSINNKDECESLREIYPFVTFIETEQTGEALFGKPYVRIDAIINEMHKHDGGVMINSDIELTDDPLKWSRCLELYANENNFLYLHRQDYNQNKANCKIYKDGIDVFFFNKQQVNLWPQTEFCMGQCFFDLVLPFHYWLNHFNMITVQVPIAYHKMHPVRYNAEHWDVMGQHAGKRFLGSLQKSGQVSQRFYKIIRSHTTYL